MDLIQLKNKDIKEIRESLLKKQGGVCAICKKIPKRPVLDHEHTKRIKGTGLCRGVLCSNCNVMIAKIENNCMRYGITQEDLPIFLINFAAYKEADQTNYIHPSEKPKEPKMSKRNYNKLKKQYKLNARKKKFPEFPKSGKLIAPLRKLFEEFDISPYN